MDLGELRARLTADAREMRAELRAIKEDLRGQSAEAKAASGSFDGLNAALSQIGLNADQIKRIQDNIRNTNPEVLRRQLEAVREQLRNMGLDAEQIAEIEEQLNDTADAADEATQSLQGIESILIAIGSIVSIQKIADIIKATVGETNKLQNSLKGLNSIAMSFHQNIDDTNDAVQGLAKDGLAPVSTYAAGLKSLLSTGLGLDQANELLETFKDRAAFGKSETISFSQAVENLAQSFKTESSEIGDLSGMTENYSLILEKGAQAIGKKVSALTQAERTQAKYLGILQLSRPYLGDAEKLTESFSGRQAALNAKWVEAQQIIGEAYIPVLDQAMETITPILVGFEKWAAQNKDVVAGITAFTLAIGALVAGIVVMIPVVGKSTVAVNYFRKAILDASTAAAAATTRMAAFGAALNVLAGPIGWIITGIGILAAGVWAYKSAADATTESIWKFAQSQEELNRKLSESPLTSTVQDVKNLQADLEKINEVLEQRKELQDELNALSPDDSLERIAKKISSYVKFDSEQVKIDELKKKINELDEQLSTLGVNTPDDAPKVLAELNEQLKDSIPALQELEREGLRNIATQVQHIDKVSDLKKQYEQLDKLEKLTTAQKSQLNEVVKQLTQEYPGLLSELDEEGRWHIKNKDLLDTLIAAEKESVAVSAQGAKDRIENRKKETEAKLKLAKLQIEALMKAEGVNLEDTKIGSKLPGNLAKGLDFVGDLILQGTAAQLQQNVNKYQQTINDLDKDLASITTGRWDDFIFKIDDEPVDEKTKKTKTKTLEEIQQEEYQAALKYIQYKRDLNQMSEKQELAALEKLEARYKKNAEIRMDVEVRIYKLRDQMNKASFDASSEWIEQEERRMTLAGKTEDEITKMKLEAWTRVRNRYMKDSELYKQADTQVYQAKVALMKSAAKAEEEAAKEQEQRNKETTKKALDAIEKAKKAELAALDERKKAIEDFYRDQERIIDDKERLKERNDLVAEMEKYRYATSEKGQKHFLELQEKLRQMDVEDQKRSLQDEREQKLEALEKEKKDIESWYDELKDATDDLTKDLTKLYKLADDERLKSFKETNALIIEEMNKLQTAMAAGTAVNAGNAAVISQMMANSAAWSSASPTDRKRLEDDNYRLGTSQGWIRKVDGRWYLPDGKTPAYHTGGFVGESNFRNESYLMPDEIQAIFKRGELALTPQQIGSIVGARGGQSISVGKIVGVELNDVVLEDEIDLRSYEKSGGNEAVEILRQQLRGGGGVG